MTVAAMHAYVILWGVSLGLCCCMDGEGEDFWQIENSPRVQRNLIKRASRVKYSTFDLPRY